MYLKRLEIQGFKTFASRTVLEFRPGITAVVGPNGSGKCVVGSSRVTLADGREIPIGELVNRALNVAAEVEALDDGWVTRQNPEGIEVLSLDARTFKLESRPVAGFVKREAPEQLLLIRTRSGRRVTVTPYHPLFTLERGELRALRADEVRAGVRVAVPRALPGAEERLLAADGLDGACVAEAFAIRSATAPVTPDFDLVPDVASLVRDAARRSGISPGGVRAGLTTLAEYAEGRRPASRSGLREVAAQIEALGAAPEQAAPLLARLRSLAESDLYWDEVVAVEATPPDDPWVYDLSVAETHNFVAENIVVHNSNLSDAVRWVLGEQSLATLRCKRSEELIYSGGGRRAPAGLAEVSLTIDNADRLLPLDFDEVTITRRATRAGDSEYFINRTRVRLRDLLEATEPLGGSYTIINQGLVDAALTLRPEERRRLFEDAAEIGGFELRKAEATRRLRETEGNLNRLSDLLAELEPRLRSLKRQAGQARQHRELSDELRSLQTRHYAAQWRAARELTARTAAEAARLERELDQARAAQAAAGAELQSLRAALRARRDELGRLHQQSSDLHRRAEAAQRDLAVGNERVAALTRRAEDLDRRRNELALRRQEAEAQRAAAAAEVAREEGELDGRRAELRAAEAELAASEEARRALAQELRRGQDASLRAAQAAAEQRTRAEQLTAQAARLEREAAELDAAVGQAAERVAAAQAQVEAARAALQHAEAARGEAAREEQAARAELDELRAARGQADEERAAARRALADAEARLDSLSRLARSYTGVFAGVRAAMQWAERAGRSGFALVQSIVRTPAELETAVEVALGSRLQNVVVERWEDAEDAIAELKRSGAGRATFMPLDTIRGGREESVRADGHNVLGVAADLVDYDPRYESVARQLLGRVLIVRDLPTARAELRRIGGGWTLVTLAGEQVNSGGSVTGGAQTKESGALRRERELRELPGQVAAARAELERAEARRVELEGRAAALAARLRELEGRAREGQRQLDQARASLDAAQRRAAQAEQERAWAGQRRERLAADSAALAAQREAAAGSLAAAEAAARAAEAAFGELRARQEAQAQADRAAQERLATLRAAAGAAEGQLRAGRQLLAAHEQTLSLVARQEAEVDAGAQTLAADREALAAEHARLEAVHRALLAEIDALRARIDPAEAELRDEEARLAELEQAEAGATAALLEREGQYNRASLDAQRAHDRQEALYERAAADDIDVEDDQSPTPHSPTPQSPNLQPDIDALKARILRLGVVNPLALEEYEETAERQRFLAGQIEDLREAGATLLELIGELDQAMSSRFTATFNAVAAEFEQSFVRLFGGGSAKLVLTGPSSGGGGEGGEGVDGEQPQGSRAQGVEIIARPPGKKQQSISLLSGGERTLTAAALLFAILKVNPSPFCILDETDAALDESNVGRFRDALSYLTEQTQFILITHNRGTIEAADTLYGVSMGDDGASRTISLRVEEYVAEASS
jgi:chromosome segregation protein